MDGSEHVVPVPSSRPEDTTSEAFRAWREALWEQHPVVIWNAEFLLPTPPLTEVAKLVSEDIYYGRSGTGFWGETRFGKSSAIRYLIARVRETFQQVSVLRITADLRTRPTDTGFYGDLLDTAGFPLKKGRTASDRRQQVKSVYLSLGRNGDGRRLIVFVDEAQNWSEAEWTWLKTIQIHLAENLISMVVISFGQEQLVQRQNALKESGRKDLTERFLRRMHRFRGIDDAPALGKVLALFDSTLFPMEGGVPFTEFFFPLAFKSGFRFAQESRRCVDAFLGLRGQQEIGMEWIALACKYFLTEYSEEDRSGWTGDADHWRRAVRFSDWGNDDDSDA